MNKLTSRIAMTVAVLLFIGGSVLGSVLLLQPANTQVEKEQCDTQTIDKGDDLTPNLVSVNIYNAGEKAGQANRVSINLQREGFLAGEVDNAPEGVESANVTVVAEDTDHPAAKLLSQQFKGKVETSDVPEGLSSKDLSSEGIALIIGADYKGIKKNAPRELESDRKMSVCVPREQGEE